METARLDMALVYPSENGRPVVPAQVDRLAESLSVIGLRQPITVRPCKRFLNGQEIDAFEVIAGRHRYEAAVRLKWNEVDAVVMEGDEDDAALWEIDENFARAELTDAQRADHHVRREEILKRKGLVKDAPKGGKPRNGDKLSSYSDQAATALGVDKRTVQRDLARGKKITPDVLAEVAGTELDKGVVLDELARTPAEAQRAKLAEITLRRQEAERVKKDAEAANRATDRVVQMTDAERFAEWIMARTDLSELPTIIAWVDGTKPRDVSAALRRLAQ
jgi:ParB-like chromosome segregation protein Spo0J